MENITKQSLSLYGRSDAIAVALRVKAARLASDLSQKDLAEAVDRRVSNISNIERGKNLPGWPLLTYLHLEQRIDVSFIVVGAYAQLPADVQERIFAELREVVARTDLLDDQHRSQLLTT